jgi:ABC-type uncharacterized transport system permease subunit
MVTTTLTGIVALLFYAGTLALQRQTINNGALRSSTRPGTLWAGLIGVSAHLCSAGTLIYRDTAYHFGLIEISSLIFALIMLLTLLSNMRRQASGLILAAAPLAMLSILLSLSIRSTYPPQHIEEGIAAHVIISIVAYSLFTIAAVQSLFLAFQNHQLKHHHVARVMRWFPPLQDMERLLFELLWTAQILLSLAIVAGFVFISDIGAQGLPHKMFFSLLSWTVFAALLIGRHRLGWRGNTAIKGTLTGFAFLLVGFYGSKFVLEYIL